MPHKPVVVDDVLIPVSCLSWHLCGSVWEGDQGYGAKPGRVGTLDGSDLGAPRR